MMKCGACIQLYTSLYNFVKIFFIFTFIQCQDIIVVGKKQRKSTLTLPCHSFNNGAHSDSYFAFQPPSATDEDSNNNNNNNNSQYKYNSNSLTEQHQSPSNMLYRHFPADIIKCVSSNSSHRQSSSSASAPALQTGTTGTILNEDHFFSKIVESAGTGGNSEEKLNNCRSVIGTPVISTPATSVAETLTYQGSSNILQLDNNHNDPYIYNSLFAYLPNNNGLNRLIASSGNSNAIDSSPFTTNGSMDNSTSDISNTFFTGLNLSACNIVGFDSSSSIINDAYMTIGNGGDSSPLPPIKQQQHGSGSSIILDGRQQFLTASVCADEDPFGGSGSYFSSSTSTATPPPSAVAFSKRRQDVDDNNNKRGDVADATAINSPPSSSSAVTADIAVQTDQVFERSFLEELLNDQDIFKYVASKNPALMFKWYTYRMH